MTVADELDAVINQLPPAHQEAARKLVEEIRVYDNQLSALKGLINDRIRELDSSDEGEDSQ
tara:strand:- start:151 stop:333 length:183 start_codon:yes stop_codon:yes gene_type:complete